jgi:hypothetical protein
LPYDEYEAEDATTNGRVIGPSRTFGEVAAEASGRRAVRLDATGQYEHGRGNRLSDRRAPPRAGSQTRGALGAYAHDGWWPDAEASFATISADAFKGTPIQEQYESMGNAPARFPEFVKRVISMDLKPYDWSKDVKAIQAPMFIALGDVAGLRYEHALELFRAKGGGKMGDMSGCPSPVSPSCRDLPTSG